MKKNTLLVLVAGFMFSVLGCTKDPIITEPTNSKVEKPKPSTPGENKPGNGDDKPTPPIKPGQFKIPDEQLSYYKEIDFKKTGIALKEELSKLVTSTHTHELNYGQIANAAHATDITPDGNNVYLLYGHPGVEKGVNSFTRKKEAFEGNKTNAIGADGLLWNKEHTYAKSLGNPNLETKGPGADAHHLRPADKGWNAARASLKFAKGAGLSGKVSGGWYPGDEWRGDVARMMMYMYVHYSTRCLPGNVAVGSTTKTPDGMVDILLEWNAADPVSDIERKRNEYHANTANQYAQGNRNPFIDNPYLATQIWGGPEATNLWK